MFRRVSGWLLVAGFVAGNSAAAAAPGFYGLGDLPGGGYSSAANDVSDDGLVVVGESIGASGTSGFRWTAAAGIQPLPLATATATNADGSVVAGKNLRWTAATGALPMQGVFDLDFGAHAAAMSSSGNVVVGTWDLVHSFRWVSGAGAATAVGDFSLAADVTGDGAAVLGLGTLGPGIWRAGQPVQLLGSLPSELVNYPVSLADNGSVAVGIYLDFLGQLKSYRWTQADGMVPLPHLVPGSPQLLAADISGDGTRIVGVDAGGTRQDAFLWTPSYGTLDLQNWLVANGFAIPAGWSLSTATAISANGLTIVGEGVNPQGQTEGWAVRLPGPGDATRDGIVDGADYTAWADHFLTTTNLFAHGDFNWDGLVDGADYTVWADHFAPFAASPFAAGTIAVVPEPGAGWLLASGGALLVLARRMRAGRRGANAER
ncbi:MAG: hypothetical protein JNG90_11895 [Planctomycetaceae bacterium]|nr:hypothetical protein [Planctomycetaceae bacterium]